MTEDLENVSEMVEKRVLPMKTTRARVVKSAASENNTYTCTCTYRICNLISAEKATFQREKCLAMSNGQCLVYVHPIRVHLDSWEKDSVNSISSEYRLRKPAEIFFNTTVMVIFFEISSQKSCHSTLAVNATVLT